MAYRLGVDVGGTFTDLFLVSEGNGGAQFRVKTPSTPDDPSEGVLTGVRRICDEAGIGVGELQNILHGTTVATNAVLESKGARVGLITTEGFGQILHLARSQTPGPLAGWIIMIKPDPPASLADTREAVERLDARGNVVVPVDEAQVEEIVHDLVGSGIESLTVALINSYVNPAHEEQIGAIVERLYPGFPVTLSAHVLPEFREYERALTACMNSYVRPKVADYVGRLQSELQSAGANADVNILRSDAGLMTTREAARNPIYAVLSGPSGGVAGALFVARKAGFDDILTFDMGGTSTDVALCQNGQPSIGRETSISHFRIRVPSVDVHTVGAGGGSIAHVPQLTKALRVGPESAGAAPGPAAYGRGGELPTVTDANVVLGHLPPQLLGGEMSLDVEAARSAVQTIADAMGLGSVEEAAEGILAIVNENMAGALRLVSVQRGHDPRDFALVAYGGAGPLHANAVAKLMGSFPVLVPPAPGLLCAIGDLVADFRDEFAQTYIRLLSEAEPARGRTAARRARRPGRRVARRARGSRTTRGRSRTRPTCATTARATRSPWPSTPTRSARSASPTSRSASTGSTSSSTASACTARRRRSSTSARSASAACRSPSWRSASPEARTRPARSSTSTRSGSTGEQHATTIYDRSKLRPQMRFEGPAIVTEFDSTTVVLPGYVAEVDVNFNILINPDGEAL